MHFLRESRLTLVDKALWIMFRNLDNIHTHTFQIKVKYLGFSLQDEFLQVPKDTLT